MDRIRCFASPSLSCIVILTLLSIALASALPFAARVSYPTPTSKVLVLFLGFSVCFVILSISVEGLFYFAYALNLLLWTEVEAVVRHHPRRDLSPKADKPQAGYQLQMDDLRIAVFFLFFVQVAFFGTGK